MGRYRLIILTRNGGVPIWCMLKNYRRDIAHEENDMGLYGVEFLAQEPTRETVWMIWVNKILQRNPCGVCNSPVVNLVTEGWRFDRTPRSQVNCYSKPLISTVNWMRYTVLKPGQSRARFEDPSAILNAGTWSHLGGKFKR